MTPYSAASIISGGGDRPAQRFPLQDCIVGYLLV
jgi:hypothetical protein